MRNPVESRVGDVTQLFLSFFLLSFLFVKILHGRICECGPVWKEHRPAQPGYREDSQRELHGLEIIHRTLNLISIDLSQSVRYTRGDVTTVRRRISEPEKNTFTWRALM